MLATFSYPRARMPSACPSCAKWARLTSPGGEATDARGACSWFRQVQRLVSSALASTLSPNLLGTCLHARDRHRHPPCARPPRIKPPDAVLPCPSLCTSSSPHAPTTFTMRLFAAVSLLLASAPAVLGQNATFLEGFLNHLNSTGHTRFGGIAARLNSSAAGPSVLNQLSSGGLYVLFAPNDTACESSAAHLKTFH